MKNGMILCQEVSSIGFLQTRSIIIKSETSVKNRLPVVDNDDIDWRQFVDSHDDVVLGGKQQNGAEFIKPSSG